MKQLCGKKASRNSKLNFLNVQTIGLAKRVHPVLSGVLTTQEAVRTRIHVKMLSGDYTCYAYLGSDRNQDAQCRICQSASPYQPAPWRHGSSLNKMQGYHWYPVKNAIRTTEHHLHVFPQQWHPSPSKQYRPDTAHPWPNLAQPSHDHSNQSRPPSPATGADCVS